MSHTSDTPAENARLTPTDRHRLLHLLRSIEDEEYDDEYRIAQKAELYRLLKRVNLTHEQAQTLLAANRATGEI